MTVYLAGKITGFCDYKSYFNEAQKFLEKQGHIVLSPAILPSYGFSYDAYIRMSSAMLKECEAICLLPNWKDSKGANKEYAEALAAGKIIYELVEDNYKTSIDFNEDKPILTRFYRVSLKRIDDKDKNNN